MSLPVIDVPKFTINIPSTNKDVTARPFLVKEEKILLIAMQENAEDSMMMAVKQIIENCTFGKVDVDTLTTFDIEYIFLKLRIKSRGSEVDLNYTCTCGHQIPFKFDLVRVKLHKSNGHSAKIMITDSVGIMMNYPSFKSFKTLQQLADEQNITKIYEVFASFIESIFDGQKVYSEYTKDELQKWIENLNDDQFGKIKEFFETMPKLKAEVDITCHKCQTKDKVLIEGLQNFLE